jgi:hypothetical protein
MFIMETDFFCSYCGRSTSELIITTSDKGTTSNIDNDNWYNEFLDWEYDRKREKRVEHVRRMHETE